MSSLNGRKVAIARVHAGTPIQMGSAGNLTSPITPDSKGALGAIELTIQEPFLRIVHKGTECLVPLTNFASLVLAPETTPAKK